MDDKENKKKALELMIVLGGPKGMGKGEGYGKKKGMMGDDDMMEDDMMEKDEMMDEDSSPVDKMLKMHPLSEMSDDDLYMLYEKMEAELEARGMTD